MTKLICLFIRECVESEIVRIGNARTTGARPFERRCGCWRESISDAADGDSETRAGLAVCPSLARRTTLRLFPRSLARRGIVFRHLSVEKARDGVDAHRYIND
jgi:hypothetical protein